MGEGSFLLRRGRSSGFCRQVLHTKTVSPFLYSRVSRGISIECHFSLSFYFELGVLGIFFSSFLCICFGRMESKYRSWIHEKENPSESVDSIEDLRRELQTTLGTTKWQVISISSIKFLWFLILVGTGFSIPHRFCFDCSIGFLAV